MNLTLVSCCLSVAIASSVAAQVVPVDSAHAKTQLHGRLLGVYDGAAGTPVVGAEVIDLMTGDHTVTSGTGSASLWFVRRGGSVVEVRKLGYEPWQSIVDPNDTTPITVVLKPVAALGAVIVTAKPNIAEDAGVRAGFERRCQAANVACVHEDVINSHPTNTLGDLLLKTPGMLTKGRTLQMHSTQGGNCEPSYFVDGFRWDTKRQGLPIDQPGDPAGGSSRPRGPAPPFNTSNVESVEVYPAGAVRPLRFSGDASCGVIAIWTK